MNLDQTELDRLLALSAGPELDAAVAEYVMRMQKCEKFLCLPEHGCRCPIHGTMVEWPDKGKPWNPSADDTACRLVTDRIAELGEKAQNEFGLSLAALIEPEEGEPTLFESMTASPLLKCRAALQTVALFGSP